MKVSIGGFLQGECDKKTAQETANKFDDVVILATCIVCGHRQRIKTVADKCDKCSTINWK